MLKNEPSTTAKVCAFARAHHSNYAREKIYDDYLAYDLLGKSEYEQIKERIIHIVTEQDWQIPELDSWEDFLDELVSPIILSRIKYAEESILQYAAATETIQYVICGAGLDSFAFRNTNPGIEIYELDHPNTHKYKLERIRELGWIVPPNVHYVSIDFETQDMKEKLVQSGFLPHKETVFALLGVTYYLELPALVGTFRNMSLLTGGQSRILLDYPDREIVHKDRARMQVLNDITGGFGEPMRGGISWKELRSELERHGYHMEKHYDAGTIQKIFIGEQLKAYENVNFLTVKKQVKEQ